MSFGHSIRLVKIENKVYLETSNRADPLKGLQRVYRSPYRGLWTGDRKDSGVHLVPHFFMFDVHNNPIIHFIFNSFFFYLIPSMLVFLTKIHLWAVLKPK